MSAATKQSGSRRCRSSLRRATFIESLDQRLLLAGRIFATVIGDLNGNGVKDAGEEGLQNVLVYVDMNRNGTFDAAEPNGLTDIDGEIKIENVATGSRLLRQDPPAGWTASPSSSLSMELTVINEQLEVFFYDTPGVGGGVEGTVWNDIDGDGSFTAVDEGLNGWTVFIDANANAVLDAGDPSAVSDSSGYYSIPDVTPGTYRIYEVVAPGWEPTIGYDSNLDVTIPVGGMANIDFGNVSLNSGSIKGVVWNDVNADGIHAASDPGLSDWTLFIDSNSDGSYTPGERTAITDPIGNYSFPVVAEGSFTVGVILQVDWNTSNPATGFRTVTVVNQQDTIADFGVYTPTPGAISGLVWNDLNGDGSFLGEAGLGSWQVFVDANGNGLFDVGEPSTNSAANGSYTITGVPAGSWQVREIVLSGWSPTAPGTGVQLVTVPNGSTIGNVNFGNKQRTDGTIAGVVYADYDHDGIRDTAEPGLSGLTVYLDVNDNNSLDIGEPSAVTSVDLYYTPAINEQGSYSFTHLSAGSYRVRQIVPAILSETLAADRSKLISLGVGEQRLDVNFADRYRQNEIHGVKFDDVNGNHQRDAGEPGIAGVVIYVDMDRDNVLDRTEPRTETAADGSYSFTTNLTPGAYVLRELMPSGYTQTYPTTTGGILWPSGVSNPAFGNVSPTSITTSLAQGETSSHNVSITLPNGGGLTNMVDVFLLFDDTGSFTANSPIVRAAFPQIISSLQASLPGVNLAFGVGRFEEYANFASEYSSGRPFVLNQPMIASSVPGFSTAIQSALDRTAPGYGGDTPETVFEALFQTVTGRGFDGNNNGSTSDSGAAGLVSTQLTPGASGDVPSFASFTVDASGNVLPASGTIGGAGFRPGALPVILLATDTGFAFQPRGETSITGMDGLNLPISALTQTSRNTTPFSSGAGIQETITGLNALGALVLGLGTNPDAGSDPRLGLESIARLTGAINRSTGTIANGTVDAIAPGDPFYFQISSGFGPSVANGVISAISNAVTNTAMNITIRASDPTVHLTHTPGVVNGVGAGETASFLATFEGDGRPHRFDLQFIREGTEVVLGSIPVVIGTPIAGDGYEFDDLDHGEIDDNVDFGNKVDPLAPLNVIPSFTAGADVSLLNTAGEQAIVGWATNMYAGSPAESGQLLTFLVSSDRGELFSIQPSVDEDGVLRFTPALGAVGTATVTVRIHDSGGTYGGGIDTGVAQTFHIVVGTDTPQTISAAFLKETGHSLQLDFGQDVLATLTASDLQIINVATNAPVAIGAVAYDPGLKRATITFAPTLLASGNYRLSIAQGACYNLAADYQFNFHFLQADFDDSGAVDFADLLLLAQNYGQTGRVFSQGNANYSTDGMIDFDDLLILAQNYGQALVSQTLVRPMSAAAKKNSAKSLFGNGEIV